MLIVIFMGKDHKQGFGPDFCKIIFFKIVSCILTTELLRLKIYSEVFHAAGVFAKFCGCLMQCSAVVQMRYDFQLSLS